MPDRADGINVPVKYAENLLIEPGGGENANIAVMRVDREPIEREKERYDNVMISQANCNAIVTPPGF